VAKRRSWFQWCGHPDRAVAGSSSHSKRCCGQILAAEFYLRVAASAIDAMQQIPAREMPVQARDPSLELGVLIKRPFGVRVTNGCEIV